MCLVCVFILAFFISVTSLNYYFHVRHFYSLDLVILKNNVLVCFSSNTFGFNLIIQRTTHTAFEP